ncbi:MAG: hypothetical protein AB7S36_12215, partial [Planctomycetota bacterium]
MARFQLSPPTVKTYSFRGGKKALPGGLTPVRAQPRNKHERPRGLAERRRHPVLAGIATAIAVALGGILFAAGALFQQGVWFNVPQVLGSFAVGIVVGALVGVSIHLAPRHRRFARPRRARDCSIAA